ncbi:MAG: hypothetical protein AAGB04_30875 [Pseudomonadota bacterium]
MNDKFDANARSVLSPSENAFAVVPSDSEPLHTVPKFLYVGEGGSVALRAKDATEDVIFENVPAGGYIYVRASLVRETGTTASSIVACG